MKTIKIYGHKKAIGEYKNWLSRAWGNKAKIMLDLETGHVWCDAFTSCNEWIEYHDSNVICLSDYIFDDMFFKMNPLGDSFTYKDITYNLLKEYALELIKD